MNANYLDHLMNLGDYFLEFVPHFHLHGLCFHVEGYYFLFHILLTLLAGYSDVGN